MSANDINIRIKALLGEILRVNFSGEMGAKVIYQGQIAATKIEENKQILHTMLSTELVHLEYFEKVCKEYQARPSILNPIWKISGKAMGFISAKAGMDSAMALTAGIEDEICRHYERQIIQLDEILSIISDENKYFNIVSGLREQIAKFLQDEEGHRTEGDEMSNNSIKCKIARRFAACITKSAIALSSKL